jgi:hypothetical protein
VLGINDHNNPGECRSAGRRQRLSDLC